MSQPYLPPTTVDPAQLDQAAVVLEQIQQFIETHCLAEMPAISEALGNVTNVVDRNAPYQFTRGATYFGGFRSGFAMQEQNDNAYRQLELTLREVSEHLIQAAEATRSICENYRTVEARNRAVAQDIERALSGYELTPPGSSSSVSVMV
jgi:hypothetical protein